MRNNKAQFKFQPFSDKQVKLLSWWMDNSPHSDKDIVIADGSIRAGKTVSMICGFIDWSIANFENQNFIIAGKSMGALTKNVLNPMKKILNAKGLEFTHIRSTEEPRVEIGSNYYYLYGANNVSSKDTLQGLTAAGSFADQVELFPENFVNEMVARCSVEGSRHWFNSNPDSPYHFLKKEWIDKKEEKRIYHLHFTMADNLTLSQKIIDRYKRMYSGVYYDRYIRGLWVVAEGLVYPSFNDDNIIDKVPNNVDIVQEFIGVDYGAANPTAFGHIGIGSDNRMYLLNTYYHSGREGTDKANSQYRKDLQNFITKHDINPKWIFIDPSAKSFRVELYQHRHEFPAFKRIAKANNSVNEGIEKVSNLITLNKFQVLKHNEKAKEEFHSYRWDEKASDRGEDKPIKENDHIMDLIRYVVNSTPRIYKRMIHN